MNQQQQNLFLRTDSSQSHQRGVQFNGRTIFLLNQMLVYADIKELIVDQFSGIQAYLARQARIQRGGGGDRGSGPPPPGKSQVIWVSIGNKQLDPPGKCFLP